MEEIESSLVIYFEEPFWVGVFEKVEGGKYSAAKVTFGLEPSSAEVYDFIMKCFDRVQFSEKTSLNIAKSRINIGRKKLMKEAREYDKRVIKGQNGGTKAQEEIKKQYRRNKEKYKKQRRKEKIMTKEEKYIKRKVKKKEKRRGR